MLAARAADGVNVTVNVSEDRVNVPGTLCPVLLLMRYTLDDVRVSGLIGALNTTAGAMALETAVVP